MGLPGNRVMEPWVLVAGGFHHRGGMDRLNLALAAHLVDCGDRVHLVCHNVDPALREKVAAVKIVPRPGRSFMLGELLLARDGRRMASVVRAESPEARVVVNGGNCNWPDINWVHCVHHAWELRDDSSPAWFKLMNSLSRWLSCRREQAVLRTARIVIANSERTRNDLINCLRIDQKRIRVIYPGADTNFSPPTPARRAAARAWLGKDEHKPLVAFVGALGRDSNKGLDVLLSAWQRLCARVDWDADLIVAGFGRAKDFWKRQIAEAGLEGRVSVLGFTDRMPDLLAAVDLLVSPVRYESYGLNVQEAICCGVPAMVTRTAGVAERYPVEMHELLIDDPEDAQGLTGKICHWRSDIAGWKQRIAPLSKALRSYTLEDMAKEMVAIAQSDPREGFRSRISA